MMNLNLTTVSVGDHNDLKLSNQLIGAGPMQWNDWKVWFNFERTNRQILHLKCQNNVQTAKFSLCEFALDGHNYHTLISAAGDDRVHLFASDAVADLLSYCSDALQVSATKALIADNHRQSTQLTLMLNGERDGVALKLSVTSVSLELLAYASNTLTKQTDNDQHPLLTLAHTLTISMYWSTVAIGEISEWCVGDFLTIGNAQDLLSGGLRVSLRDATNFGFAEALCFENQMRIELFFNNAQSVQSHFWRTNEHDCVSAEKDMTMTDLNEHKNEGSESASIGGYSAHDVAANETLPARFNVPITIRLGSLRMSLIELQSLTVGQVINTESNTTNDVLIFAGDNQIASGSLCEINGNFGVLIRSMVWNKHNLVESI
jgi:flagellar motor switch/type III secretory pathway protein FliN